MNKNYILKSGVLLFFVFSLSLFLVVFSIYYFNAEIHENDNLAIFVNGQKVSDVPSKNSGYYFEKAECDDQTGNEVHIVWDNETWSPVISNMHNYPTRCNLYFTDKSFCESDPDTAACTLLAQGETDELKFDKTVDNNLRYTSLIANNFIDIGEEYLSASEEMIYINIDTSFLRNEDMDACANFYYEQNLFEGKPLEAFRGVCTEAFSTPNLQELAAIVDYVNRGLFFNYDMICELLSIYINEEIFYY